MSTARPYIGGTLILAAVALLYVAAASGPERPGPRLERPAGTASRPGPAPAVLSARRIIEIGRDLDLQPDQIVRLAALDARWRRESQEIETALEPAIRELTAFLTGAQERGGAGLVELQRRSADYQELSAELRQRRLRHAAEALAVLSGSQKQLAIRAYPLSGGDP